MADFEAEIRNFPVREESTPHDVLPEHPTDPTEPTGRAPYNQIVRLPAVPVRDATEQDTMKLGSPVASGTFAYVYKVKARIPARMLAVKRLHHYGDMQKYAEACGNEIAVMRYLKGCGLTRGLLELEDCFREADGTVSIVTKWHDSPTGETFLDNKALAPGAGIDEPTCRKVTKSLLEALKNLWDHGIVHRDIKLNNFLVAPDRSVTLLDFGNALFLDRQALSDPDYEHVPLSRSPHSEFRPPFVHAGRVRREDLPRIDLYGAARCALALLCGLTAFQTMPAQPDLAPLPISAEGKHFLSAALSNDHYAFQSAADALLHPWITGQPLPKPLYVGVHSEPEFEPFISNPMELDH